VAELIRSPEIRVHLVVVVLVALSLLVSEPRTTLVFGGTLCFFAYLFIGVREARKAPLFLSPLSFYFLWYIIGVGLSPVYIGLTLDSGETIRFASTVTSVEFPEAAIGYVVYLCGSFSLHVGMQLLRPRMLSTPSEKPAGNLIWWFVLVWAAGMLFQVSPASFSFLGATARILSVAVVGSVCAFAITPRLWLKVSLPAFMIILVIGSIGLFFGNLASGSKAFIMFSFLPITWHFIIQRRLRIWIPVLAITLATFYFVIVAPVVYTARQNTPEEGEDPRAHLMESFDSWMNERPDQLNQTFFADQIDQFVNRQFDPAPVGFIVGEVKRSGLLYGETLKYAGYAFVPRVLWPDKPSVTRGAWFSTYLGLFQTESEATTSIGMTAAGELYWNYGTVGVLLGMLAIGCLQGLLWRMAGADPRGKPIQMLLYVSTMLSMTDMPEAVTVIVSVVVTLLTFKAVLLAIGALKRRRHPLQLSPSYR
jgi:hypothetical protein